MSAERMLQAGMFGDGSEETGVMWRTPAAQEPGINPDRLVDKDGNRPTHFNQRLYDKDTGRMAQHSLAQDVMIAGCSPPATPASRSAVQGNGPERMTPGTSGRGFASCLPRLTPTVLRGFVLRMSAGTSAWASTVCSLTWKTSATPARRGLFLLRASARSTGGIGSGSSDAALIPTPTASDNDNRHSKIRPSVRKGEHGWSVMEAAIDMQSDQPLRMWPTPQAANVTNDLNVRTASQREPHHPPNKLGWAVAERMWPTPTVQQGRNETSGRSTSDSQHHSGTTPNDLAYKQGQRMWGTPRASDWKGCGPEGSKNHQHMEGRGYLPGQVANQQGQKLNPAFVTRLMGYPDDWLDLED